MSIGATGSEGENSDSSTLLYMQKIHHLAWSGFILHHLTHSCEERVKSSLGFTLTWASLLSHYSHWNCLWKYQRRGILTSATKQWKIRYTVRRSEGGSGSKLSSSSILKGVNSSLEVLCWCCWVLSVSCVTTDCCSSKVFSFVELPFLPLLSLKLAPLGCTLRRI